MISFSWSVQDDGKYKLEVRTPITRIGTLYRLTASIYIVGLDIASGEVETVNENGQDFSMDSFILQEGESRGAEAFQMASAQLGLLMETLIQQESNVDDLLVEHNIRIPDISTFFDAPPEMLFQNNPDDNYSEFYIETVNRRGLLFHLTRILAREKVDILGAVIRSNVMGRAEDTFSVQYDGGPLPLEVIQRLELDITGEVTHHG